MKRKIILPDSLITGHNLIDKDHQSIVDLLNEIFETFELGSLDQMKRLINKILSKINSHYDLEETVLREYDFDNYESHKLAHANQKKRLSVFADSAKYITHLNQSDRLIDNLVDFVVNDIIRGDGEIKTYMKNLVEEEK